MQSSDFQIGERGMLKCCHNQRMTFESINSRFQSAYSDKLSPLELGAGGGMSSAHPYFISSIGSHSSVILLKF